MRVPEGLKRSAVIVIVRHGLHSLLLLRVREPNRGLYVPVGGKLDQYESPRRAAVRELREEAGIEFEHVRLAGTLVETAPNDYNWWSAIYVADLPIDSPRPEVIPCVEGELGWFERDAIATLPMPDTDHFIYDYLHRGENFALAADYDGELKLTSLVEEFTGQRLI